MSAPDSNSLSYGERKNKGDKSLSSKVAKSRKKVEAEVDKLAKVLPGKMSRAERVARARAVLESRPGPVDNPQQLVDSLSKVFLTGIIPCPGEVSELLPLWQLFLKVVEEIQPDAAHQLRSDQRHYEAFTWATVGAVGVIGDRLNPVRRVLLCKAPKGKRKGDVEVRFLLSSGKVVRAPKNFQPVHPEFLWPGTTWLGKPVPLHAVGNVKCLWTVKELKAVFKPLLWRPSPALLKRLRG